MTIVLPQLYSSHTHKHKNNYNNNAQYDRFKWTIEREKDSGKEKKNRCD